MSQRTIDPTRPSDRLSYLWLALAAALFLFNVGRWAVPLAVWLAPLFLLRFMRTQRPLRGFLLAWLVRAPIAMLVLQGFLPFPGVLNYLLICILTALATLPYLADRLIAPRLPGFVATLVFPAALTTFEYLGALGSFGTFPSIANTQYGNLPLLQLASVTGIWGITFLIAWFAAVVNWAWEREFAWPEVRRGALLYAAILAAVLLGGGARLALLPPAAAPVRVAGLSAPQADVAALDRQLSDDAKMSLAAGKATPADRALAHAAYVALDGDLLARSRQEAQAGAKIVVWPEASTEGANVLQEDAPALLQQASALARQEGIYLDMGLAVLLPAGGRGPFVRDEAVLIDPAGNVAWTYEKTHLVPGEEQSLVVPGDGRVPLADSPYGRLANVICYDLDFPGTMRQAGQGGADLVLAPSNDWQAVDPAHTQAATLRAVEDGFSLVRQASNGLSEAVDYQGHVLAAADYFTTGQQTMVAYVPARGVRTIYAAVGDVFAWLCVIVLAACAGWAIVRGRKRSSQPVAPLPEPGAAS